MDDSTTLGLKTSSNEKSTNGKVTYTNFSVNEYSSTKTNEVSFQGTLSHNAFDDLKHKHRMDEEMAANAYPPQMGELKVTELGIPMQDYEYENNYSSNIEPRKSSSIDNDNISQADLVGHAARH